MEDLFQDKYRAKSARFPNWDYGSPGFYFITICANNREEHLGDVLVDNDGNASVALTAIGVMVRDCWLEIPNHFPFVVLDEFIVMPNHIHGVIVIGQNENQRNGGRDEALPRLYLGKHPNMSKISPQPKSLSVIIDSFKSIVTKSANKEYPDINFAWQPRFYDHIIRTEKTLQKIRQYIRHNPLKWQSDRNNPENLRV